MATAPGSRPSSSLTQDLPAKTIWSAGKRTIDAAQRMKPPLRGKYLVREHAVELRRIIPALPKAQGPADPRDRGGIPGGARRGVRRAHLRSRCVTSGLQGGERASSLTVSGSYQHKTRLGRPSPEPLPEGCLTSSSSTERLRPVVSRRRT